MRCLFSMAGGSLSEQLGPAVVTVNVGHGRMEGGRGGASLSEQLGPAVVTVNVGHGRMEGGGGHH